MSSKPSNLHTSKFRGHKVAGARHLVQVTVSQHESLLIMSADDAHMNVNHFVPQVYLLSSIPSLQFIVITQHKI